MSGLFDFVKTIGKKIFGEGEPDAGAKIAKALVVAKDVAATARVEAA